VNEKAFPTGMATKATDPDLVHWRSLPEGKQALEFTAQGWAIVEVCAALGEFQRPQDLIAHMLGQIINGFVETDTKSTGGELQAEWSMQEDGLTATVAFGTDALKAVSGVLDMDLGELQSALQASLELSLLELYNEHSDKQRLH
jgi:hypothetical protein